jgi:hypothetical protein
VQSKLGVPFIRDTRSSLSFIGASLLDETCICSCNAGHTLPAKKSLQTRCLISAVCCFRSTTRNRSCSSVVEGAAAAGSASATEAQVRTCPLVQSRTRQLSHTAKQREQQAQTYTRNEPACIVLAHCAGAGPGSEGSALCVVQGPAHAWTRATTAHVLFVQPYACHICTRQVWPVTSCQALGTRQSG